MAWLVDQWLEKSNIGRENLEKRHMVGLMGVGRICVDLCSSHYSQQEKMYFIRGTKQAGGQDDSSSICQLPTLCAGAHRVDPKMD